MLAQDFEENYGTGWIKLYRSIRQHWIWKDPKKLKWWIDILLQVNHSGGKVAIGYTLMEYAPGECLISIENWAKRWRVSKGVAYRFLKLLEKDNMICLKNETKTTRLTVCEYASYQQKPNDNGTQAYANRTRTVREPYTDKNVKNADNAKKDTNIPFDSFWNLYGKKVGAKKRCEAKWLRLTDEDRAKIMETLPAWKAAIRDEKFQPFPETYLNQERWHDEIKQPQKLDFRKIL